MELFLFSLKKMVGGILQPLPFFLLLMGFSLCLLWFSRWQKSAKSLLTISWLSLFLLSLQPVADSLLLPLESDYSTYNVSDTTENKSTLKYVVVLGGGHVYNPDWAPSSNILNNSLPRINEGIRIYRDLPEAKLIFTGGPSLNLRSAAESAQEVAISLGVPKSDILLADKAKDTEEEAEAVKSMVGDSPFILVTSANHLPRAIGIFHRHGLKPIAAPANQLAITTPITVWEKWLPSAQYLSHSERVWYEYIGSVWNLLKPNSAQTELSETK